MTRMHRLGLVGALLTSIFFALSCATAEQGDGARPPGPRIIAIGDLHGDYEGYLALLREADLIDGRRRWSGGDAIFVQTGDVPDRGPDSLKIIKHLQKLADEAEREGGRVVTLVGNHEAMNVIGDLRYVHPGEYEAFRDRRSRRLRAAVFEANREVIETSYLEIDPTLSSNEIKAAWEAAWPLGKIEHRRAWRAAGELGAWVAQNQAVALIDGTLFAHGGLSKKYAAYTVDEINNMTAAAILAERADEQSILVDPAGPLWYRGNIQRDEPGERAAEAAPQSPDAPPVLTIEEELDLVLNAFGAARLVVGHTVSRDGVKARYGGKLVQIDTGIAPFYQGTDSFLEIRDGILYAHDDGVTTRLDAPEQMGESQ